jgi:hypothetical protein
MRKTLLALLTAGLVAAAAAAAHSDDDQGWGTLVGTGGFEAWKPPIGDWVVAPQAAIDPENPKRLRVVPGERGPAAAEVIVNGPTGKTHNLTSKAKFGDIEAHIEFMVPKGSNSGVKFMGLYEIQIFDSWGVKQPTASDCGGIYPRAELQPRYHHIDKGVPPRVNASRAPGEWQTLDVVFQTPRFDDAGKKTAHARFIKVVLNGELIHDDVELPYPTGHAWHDKEVASGPLLLQADHGPVAFRNVRIRPRVKAE